MRRICISYWRRAAILCLALLAALAGPSSQAAQPGQPPAIADGEAAATVNGETISAEEFQNFFRIYVAQTYYHGVEPDQRAAIADEAMALLINDRLLLQEAGKRGLKGDRDEAKSRLAALKKRFVSTPEKIAEFEKRSAEIESEVLDDTKIEELQAAVKDAGALSSDAVRAFYEANHNLFTTPETTDVSMILIGVPPSGLTEEWDAAVEKATDLHARLKAGEPFEKIASENSSDPSAEQGGRLGPLHEGQVPKVVAAALAGTAVGDVTDPIRILEGVALFKVHGREPSALQPFDAVHERAEALLRRQIEDQRWRDFLSELRAGARIDQARPPADMVRDI